MSQGFDYHTCIYRLYSYIIVLCILKTYISGGIVYILLHVAFFIWVSVFEIRPCWYLWIQFTDFCPVLLSTALWRGVGHPTFLLFSAVMQWTAVDMAPGAWTSPGSVWLITLKPNCPLQMQVPPQSHSNVAVGVLFHFPVPQFPLQ